MSQRYYLAELPSDGRATLAGTEAHHLLHVMRAGVGDEITLFDGRGNEYPAQVAELGRSEAVLSVGSPQEVNRELNGKLVVGSAIPKGDRQKWLVEKLTELGVAELQPMTTERSVADLRGKSLEKLRRSVIEASKQCGRNTLMTIHQPMPVEQFLAGADGMKLISHPGGEPVSQLATQSDYVSVAIGPEGGFTDAEIAAAIQHGWRPMSLGPAILRIETAAVAVAAILANHA